AAGRGLVAPPRARLAQRTRADLQCAGEVNHGLPARPALQGEHAGPVDVIGLPRRHGRLLPVMGERRDILDAARVFVLDRLGDLAVEAPCHRRGQLPPHLLAPLVVGATPLLPAPPPHPPPRPPPPPP